jgi:crotonobetainyl-CoA:carnitine CoA-transferase CaiB-like acyl-CoA transferase
LGALSGIQVLDLSRVLAGPYCAQMLADHGATVIKIEGPEGDISREWGPPYSHDGVSAYYAGLNRNKKHVSIDLSRQEGRKLILTMLEEADVLIENFKLGTLDRWNLGPDFLAESYPKLVHCRISGFGTSGPMAGLPGYDAVLQAYSGLMYLNGEADRGPVKIPIPLVDLSTGMLALSGILMALIERSSSGRGQVVDVSLLDSATSLLHPVAANFFMNGEEEPRRMGNGHPNVAPYESYETATGQVFVGGGSDRQFAALCDYLGASELANDVRYAHNEDRVANREELARQIERLMGQVDLDRASDEMLRHGVPAARVMPLSEALKDPQVQNQQMVIDVGSYRLLGIPVKLSRTPGTLRTPPSRVGVDTRQVLMQFGFDRGKLDELQAGKVIKSDER